MGFATGRAAELDFKASFKVQDLALQACQALGLNSGAVDIIWNEKENKCYVLEVNTAPGIEGTTCKKYTNEIIESLTSNA